MQSSETTSDRFSQVLVKLTVLRWYSNGSIAFAFNFILFASEFKVIIGSYQATKVIAKKAQKKFWGFYLYFRGNLAKV